MSNPVTGSQPGAVGSLAKGLLVLESLSTCHRVTDIAHSTGLAVSSVHRILTSLRELGWVYQDGSKVYSPGARLMGLAGVIAEDSDHGRSIREVLRPLVDSTGYTMHYATLQGYELVYVAKLEGDRSYRMRSRVGMSIPLHTTAIGKAILASMSPTQARQAITQTGLRKITDKSITTQSELFRALELIQKDGWALDDGENEDGTRCIGVAVLNSRGMAVGGVSLSALAYDLEFERAAELAPLVVAIAARLRSAFSQS